MSFSSSLPEGVESGKWQTRNIFATIIDRPRVHNSYKTAITSCQTLLKHRLADPTEECLAGHIGMRAYNLSTTE